MAEGASCACGSRRVGRAVGGRWSPSPNHTPPLLPAPTMEGWTSDSGDTDKFEWDSDGEAEPSSAPAMRNLDAPGPSTLYSNEWINGKCRLLL